ncbi:bola protein [Fimicolochytrium jonesii]|uniref:bola protein n=1 Tax=Fimicolochytrium jonesii TaxID=1396493 RepID=UPI0022FED7F5|nr:bola protein [Fimicolochytrium jonesii]KAI8820433.1 bola protein [Fimicolochytrium jonesii]
MAGPVYSSIETKLTEALQPTVLEIVDESYKHAGHAAMKGLKPVETHFRVTAVSSKFEGKRLVQRHQLVYEILGQELKEGLHALSLSTKTPEEYQK